MAIPRSLAPFALAAALTAQAPPAWSLLSVPNGVNSVDVVSIGKLTTYRDGTTLHAHSAFTRQWHSQTVSPNATLRLTNDCLIVMDGATWYGFAAHRGTFEPLPVSPQAQLLNLGGHDNDSVMLVQDGNQLHAFSGFVGTWVSRPVSAMFAWSSQRHVALLADAGFVSGMDAFTGQWHDLPVATPPSQLSTDGMAGIVIGPTAIQAFSALHATWSTAAALPGASFTRNDDWALFYDATQMLAYSGTQGRFEPAAFGATAVPVSEDCFGIVDTAAGLVAFSAIRGTFSAPICPNTARIRPNVAVATLVDGLQVYGYSATRNTAAAIPLASAAEEAAGTVAYAIDLNTGLPRCFSALTGQWHTPPGDVLAGAPQTNTASSLLATATGARAFSARTGAFVPLVAPGLTLLGNSQVSFGGAWNATDLFAFDARSDRWVAQPRTGTGTPLLQVWRTAMFAIDGATVAGFGTQDGTWATTPMPGAYVTSRANSESSRIVTPNHVLAHSGLAELVASMQFPEFRRVFAAGAIGRMYLPLHAGDLAVLAGGVFAAVPTPVPGFGTLRLDPNSLATGIVLPTPGANRAEIVLPIPANPILVGSEWAFQALVVPAAGAAYLTGAAALFVF